MLLFKLKLLKVPERLLLPIPTLNGVPAIPQLRKN